MMKLVVLNCVVILCGNAVCASAQSGSTGGSLGKSGKSVSGTVLPKRLPGSASGSDAIPATRDITGTWHWEARCATSGVWTGTVTLAGRPENLTGSFAQDQPGGDGAFLGGSASGTRITFRRRTGLLVQIWDGEISDGGSGSIIVGRASHALETCSFTARK